MTTNPNSPEFIKKMHERREPWTGDIHVFPPLDGYFNFIDDAVLNGPNEYYNFNETTLEYLFFNHLFEAIRGKNFNGPDKRKYWLEDPYEYKVNKYAFRSEEFVSDADFVFAGCSHTYGMGIPEDFIWGVQLAKKLNVDYYNLGIPGASVTTIVNNLFAYFRKFGHPKVVIINFPNFERLMLPVNPKILKPKDKKYEKQTLPLNDWYLDHSYLMEKVHPTYSKKPHNVEDVVSLDVPYWMAVQSINLLEQYCEVANIKLIWSTWDFMTYKSLLKMHKKDNSYFKYMVDIEMDKWLFVGLSGPDLYHKNAIKKDDLCFIKQDCSLNINCHEEIKNKDPKIFDLAADNAHWGTHRHTHLAETFYNYAKDLI